MLARLRGVAPASVRAALHEASGPLVVLLVAYGFANDAQAASIVAAVVTVTDLLLAMLHAETTWRTLVYPALAAVGAVLVNLGVYDQHLVAAVLGVTAAVLGSVLAARHTPVPTYVGQHRRE